MSERAEDRMAKNEALFRYVNESVKELAKDNPSPLETVDFLCECDDVSCLEAVPMRPERYELVRSNPVHFLVARGHENREIERVVGEHDGFFVVEKLPGEQEIAREMDPRSS